MIEQHSDKINIIIVAIFVSDNFPFFDNKIKSLVNDAENLFAAQIFQLMIN